MSVDDAQRRREKEKKKRKIETILPLNTRSQQLRVANTDTYIYALQSALTTEIIYNIQFNSNNDEKETKKTKK